MKQVQHYTKCSEFKFEASKYKI